MLKEKPATLWTPKFIRLLILILFVYNGISIINSTFSVYVVQQYNGSPEDVSWASSLMIISSMAFRPIAGFLIDRFGRRVTLAISMGVTALISLGYLLPGTITGLAMLRLLMGIPFAMNTAGLATLRTDLIPADRRVEGFNVTTISIMMSALVIGPNLGYFILNYGGFSALFTIASALLSIAIGNLLLLKFEDIKTTSKRFSLREIFEPRAAWFAIMLGVMMVGWPGVLTYGPLYSMEVGLSFGGYFFLAFGAGLLLSQIAGGFITNNEKSPAIKSLALVLSIIGHITISLIRNKIGFLTGAVFMGAGYALSFSIYTKLAFDLVAPERRGRCSGTLMIAEDIGATIGIYAYGMAAEISGSYADGYLVAAAATLLSLLMLIFIALPDYYRKRLATKTAGVAAGIEGEILN